MKLFTAEWIQITEHHDETTKLTSSQYHVAEYFYLTTIWILQRELSLESKLYSYERDSKDHHKI